MTTKKAYLILLSALLVLSSASHLSHAEDPTVAADSNAVMVNLAERDLNSQITRASGPVRHTGTRSPHLQCTRRTINAGRTHGRYMSCRAETRGGL